MGSKQVPCPFCNVTVLPQFLASHINRLHASQNKLVVCPHCQAKLLLTKMYHHIKTQHPTRTEPHFINHDNLEHFQTRVSPNRPVECPHCGLRLTNAKLKEHLSVAHPVTGIPLPPSPDPDEIAAKHDKEQMLKESRRIIPITPTPGYESIPLIDLD